MLFCPTCANILLTEKTPADFRFFCKTCPYVFRVNQTFESKLSLQRKEVDDVLGGEEAWENVDKTSVPCTNTEEGCVNTFAYFKQLQIRSSDEPMTTFLKCTKCGHTWVGDQ